MAESNVQDLIAAKDATIDSLLNELIGTRMALATARRELQEHVAGHEDESDPALDQAMEDHPSNGKVERSLSLTSPE